MNIYIQVKFITSQVQQITIGIWQSDAVLSGHKDLAKVTQSDLCPWILVHHQADRLDAGSVQILQTRHSGM